MTYYRQIVAQIQRLGQKAEVRIRMETGQNEFGNTQTEYTPDRWVFAFRTYPNRNTENQSGAGDRNQDSPVFIVPKGDNQPDPPNEDDRIVYEGTVYEVGSHTSYDTHVEFFGTPVIH